MQADFTPLSTYTVLIADDHALVREGLLLMFRIYEQATAVGISHQDLPNALEQYKPDVVILGLGRKQTECWTTIKTLCQSRPNLCLLLLDETVRTRNIRAALDFGLRGYWTKHNSFAQLADAARRLAVGDRSFCPEVDQYLFQTRRGLHYHPAHAGSAVETLTSRERELLILLAQGLTIKKCARQLGVSFNTLDNRKTNLMRKLNVHKTVELVLLAVREGLITAE
jgi:DNA-binding NarL/FixJ family response regulator